jgi:uncharacterized membrane protein
MLELGLLIVAGAMGALIGTELAGRLGSPTARLAMAAAGSAVGAGAGWLLFEGLVQAWLDTGWPILLTVVALLLTLSIALRRLDERCPWGRSVSSYSADPDALKRPRH